MRNRYPGICYRCNERVEVGDGHFERYQGGWRTQHAYCAIYHRDGPAEAEAWKRIQAAIKEREERRQDDRRKQQAKRVHR